jgi:sortase B
MKIRRILYIVVFAFFLGLFLVSSYRVFLALTSYQKGDAAYQEILDVVDLSKLPSPSPTASASVAETKEEVSETEGYILALSSVDFDALEQINPDIIGWILIPDTQINYPILQGSDNDYYLKHLYNKEALSVGSIFMDYRSVADFSGFNTIIYGHRMRNGSMFAGLKNFLKAEFFKEHPYIYIATREGVYTYTRFSAYEGPTTGLSYQLSFSSEQDKTDFIDYAKSSSRFSANIEKSLTEEDFYLTLSTCTGNGYKNRLIVQAVLTEFIPSEEAEEAE